MDNLEFLYSAFNENVFSSVKANIDKIEIYYRTNPNFYNNKLVEELIGAIKNYNLEALTLPVFQSVLLRSGKNQMESAEIINKIIQYKKYPKEKTVAIRECVDDIVAAVVLQQAKQRYGNSPADYLRYLKTVDFKSKNIDYLQSQTFGEIDINSIVADSNTSIIPIKYQFINQLFPEGGFSTSDLVLLSAPPGVGKSLMAMEICLDMALRGIRCLYFAAGDLCYKDFLVRMSSLYTGLSFREATVHLTDIFHEISSKIKDNLSICITPAGVVNAPELVDFVKAGNWSVVFIDYDSNLAGGDADNMYDKFGDIYNEFSRLFLDPLDSRLVFILSQPKIASWDANEIDLPMIGESARKVHTASVVITRSRVVGNPNHLGRIKVCKNRRGESDISWGSIRLGNGRIRVLPEDLYSSLKMDTVPRNYTDSDIDRMIENYNKTKGQVQHIAGGPQFGKGPSPF